mmetsp:Transcript_108161/g.271201  ORF Transcript_108161/g.271201 Transcript_108161/m.271201 type:complete len:126 (-) Transcript_108161:1043-1420(-)
MRSLAPRLQAFTRFLNPLAEISTNGHTELPCTRGTPGGGVINAWDLGALRAGNVGQDVLFTMAFSDASLFGVCCSATTAPEVCAAERRASHLAFARRCDGDIHGGESGPTESERDEEAEEEERRR